MAAVHWVHHCWWGHKTGVRHLDADLHMLRKKRAWVYQDKHDKGVAKTLADGTPRWHRPSIPIPFYVFRIDVIRQAHTHGQEGPLRLTETLVTLTSVKMLGDR